MLWPPTSSASRSFTRIVKVPGVSPKNARSTLNDCLWRSVVVVPPAFLLPWLQLPTSATAAATLQASTSEPDAAGGGVDEGTKVGAAAKAVEHP